MTATEQTRTNGLQKQKRIGRPPGGSGKAGEPAKIRDYPKLALTIKPVTKALLKSASMIEGRSEWLIVDDAIAQTWRACPRRTGAPLKGWPNE